MKPSQSRSAPASAPVLSPYISRGIGAATVTVCIPTYQSAPFITRTLAFATGQTMENIRILVSVDSSTDQTADLCREIAKTDARIDVIEAKERVGWSGNVAQLARNVDTDFFFMFYHDDVILPQFCAKMSAALIAAPEAASANCEVSWLGETERRIPAHTYSAKAIERLVTIFAYEQIPAAPMRNMIRTEKFGSDTLLEDGAEGIKLHYAFLAKMMISGSCVPVFENLYIRWIRKGGLLDSWKDKTWEDLLASWHGVLDRLLPVLTAKFEDKYELELARYALMLRARWSLHQRASTEAQKRASLFFRMDLSDLQFEPDLTQIDPEIGTNLIGLGARVKQAQKPWILSD